MWKEREPLQLHLQLKDDPHQREARWGASLADDPSVAYQLTELQAAPHQLQFT